MHLLTVLVLVAGRLLSLKLLLLAAVVYDLLFLL
jgi:hypothetical protein